MKTELEDVSDYEKHMIDEIIKFHEEKIKIELLDWQELLKTTLHISDEAALSGITALDEYTTSFYNKLGGAHSYAQIAGEDAAGVYADFADEIERAMKALMYSGKFNIDDASIRGLSDLLDKINALGKPPAKPVWQDVLKSATGFSDEEINAWEDRETIINRFIVKMSNKQDDAEFFAGEGLADYADSLSGIADEWEEIYKIMVSAMTWKDGILIQVFDPTLKENKEILDKVTIRMKEARDISNTENIKKYITGLEKELDLREKALGLTTKEARIIELTDQFGDENKARELADREEKIRGEEYINLLQQQLTLEQQLQNGFIDYSEYAIQQLMTEKGITYEHAQQAVKLQEQLEYLQAQDKILYRLQKNGKDASDAVRLLNKYNKEGNSFEKTKDWGRGFINDWKEVFTAEGGGFISEFTGAVSDLVQALLPFHGIIGEYTKAAFGEELYGAVQGTEVGAFIQGADNGITVGLIDMFANSLGSVLGGMEGLNMALSPVTSLMQGFAPILKALLVPLLLVGKGMKVVGGILETAFGWLVGDLDDLYDSLTATNDEREKESELLRRLNEQYAKLLDSIREQEEYYLKKRRELNADYAIESMHVNDMILTPHGNFSTDPGDYIIATRDPSTLGSNASAPVYINVINNSPSTVTAQEQTDPDGTRRIMVLVDQVVQNGIASGKYDGAFNMKQARDSGKRVSG
jgi:hypothetical protein